MGAFLGLLFGLGAALVLRSRTPRPVATTSDRSRRRDRLTELAAQAGYPYLRPNHVVGACIGFGLVTAIVVAGVSHSGVIALAFGGFGSSTPIAFLRRRARQRRVELRELWPDVVDNLTSAVRAGLSLPEALAQVGTRGPEPLRDPFRRFGVDYQATGRFAESLDRLKARLADPVADRIIELIRLAREVGGTDLGRLLRTLSQFLREDARTRAELETRQGWTVNAARLALTAPWAVLALLALRPETVAAYDTATGVLVLLVGGGVSFLAYRAMLRIARLPTESRVLR